MAPLSTSAAGLLVTVIVRFAESAMATAKVLPPPAAL
jgi:hypothetical protein